MNDEVKKIKAKAMRYKHALVNDLNIDTIRNRLEEMSEECSNVKWICNDEQSGLDALESILGDRDDAYEFLMDFSGLATDVDRMLNDLYETWIPEKFDDLMVAVHNAQNSGDGMMGYDSYESDYYGLDSWEMEYAIKDAKERMKRLTKDDLIDAMHQSLSIVMSYQGLCYRYDCLKAAIDILEDRFGGQLQTVKRIDELYDQITSDKFNTAFNREFDALVRELPPETWLQ